MDLYSRPYCFICWNERINTRKVYYIFAIKLTHFSVSIKMCERIVALVDMDCFYCQVETRRNPILQGKPMAVVQYNPWQGGGIIAVNYEAREFGVTRHVRGKEAKEKCPDIILVQVPEVRGKADLTRYREAGREVVDVLCEFSECVEKASVDEAYIDLTKTVEERLLAMKGSQVTPAQLANTYIVGFTDDDTNDEEDRKAGMLSWLENVYQNDFRDLTSEKLTIAALIVEEMRASIFDKTGFRCSAGIAHNKVLGKLACGIHKPNRQTILPHSGVAQLYKTLPLKKVRSLGGKFGDTIVEQLGCKVMADLAHYTESQLRQYFDDKAGSWLYNIARGFDSEPVTPRLMSKSIGCCKKFPGKQALNTREVVEKWLLDLATELSERLLKELAQNKRRATSLTVAYQQRVNSETVSSSRCGQLHSYEPQQIAKKATELIKESNTAGAHQNYWNPPLRYLGLSVGKFLEKNSIQTSTMHNFFKTASKRTDDNSLEEKPFQSEETNDVKNNEKSVGISFKDLLKTPHDADKIDQGRITALEKESFFVQYFKREGLLGKFGNASGLKSHESEIKVCDPVPSVLVGESKGAGNDPSVSDQAAPSTSGIGNHISEDSNSNQNWISLQELFPDLDQVDDDVVTLLPSPMQKQLRSRVEKHKETRGPVYTSEETDINELEFQTRNNNYLDKGENENCIKDVHKNKIKSSKNKKSSRSRLDMFYNVDDKESGLQKHCGMLESKNGGSSTSVSKETGTKRTSNVSYISESSMDVDDDLIPKPVDSETDGNSCDSVPSRKFITYAEEAAPCSIQQNKSREQEIATPMNSNKPEPASSHEDIVHVNLICDSVYNMEMEICPHCQNTIPFMDYPEHLDFHVAEELDKKLNSSAPIVSKRTEPNKTTDAGKKKRGRSSKNQKPVASDKKMRSITNFFTPVK